MAGISFEGDTARASSGGGGDGLLKSVITAPFRFQKNLLEDVVDAGLGFFPGLYHIATQNPIDTVKEIGSAEWQQWSPLFTGHPIEFAKQTFEHPLGPILDVAAIFTGGASLAGKGARLVSKAEYTTKAAGSLGKRTIALPPTKPGAFQSAITEPSLVDRLAATTRTPPELMRIDRPNAPGRLKTLGRKGDPEWELTGVARQAIPKSTSRNAFTQWAQVGLHGLSEQLASKGGLYALPAQLSYEQAQLVRLAGNAAALGWQYGQLENFTKALKEAETNPQARATLLRNYFEGNYENLVRHADKDGQLVPLADWVEGRVNKASYRMIVQKKYLMRKRGESNRAIYAGPDEEILQNFRDFGRYASTKDINKADIVMKNGVPHVRLVNKLTARNMGIEAKNATNAAMKGYFKGTNLWKGIILGLSPRFLVNNAVGNAFLLGAETMGSHAAVGMFEALRQAKGLTWAQKDLAKALKETGFDPTDANHWINRWHGDQMGQAFHSTAFRENPGTAKVSELLGDRQQLVAPFKKVTDKSFKFVGERTERDLRIAALYAKATSEPLVKEAIKRNKKRGMKDAQAVDRAIEEVYRRHPEVQRRVTDEVYSTMGNYVAMHGWERSLRGLDPFYTWQRHIMLNSTRMALKHPGRSLAAVQAGHLGSDWVKEELGQSIPGFMRSMIPGVPVPGMEGRIPVVSTSGLNPWASAADLGLTAESLLPGVSGAPRAGETVGTQLNPFVQSGIETLTGTSMLTGEPLGTDESKLGSLFQSLGPIGQFAGRPIQNLPQVKVGQALFDPDPSTRTPMFSKTPEEALFSWIGLPIKWLNQPAANTLGRQLEGRN
jgi:hypothetical protein